MGGTTGRRAAKVATCCVCGLGFAPTRYGGPPRHAMADGTPCRGGAGQPCPKPGECGKRGTDGKVCRQCASAAFGHWSDHPTCQHQFPQGDRKGQQCGAPARYRTETVVLGMFNEVKPYCELHRKRGKASFRVVAKFNRSAWSHGCFPAPTDALDNLAVKS